MYAMLSHNDADASVLYITQSVTRRVIMKSSRLIQRRAACAAAVLVLTLAAGPVGAQETEGPLYLRDRGTGVSSSMFGTYVQRHELFTYLYYEYYFDNDYEYSPDELGYGLDQDFQSKYRAHEGLIFVAFGLTDWLMWEMEAAVIAATLEKASGDLSAMPNTIEEAGLGDVETQIRWRWIKEGLYSPEVFSYFETVFPFQKDKKLIGTSAWEFKLGTGVTKGFGFGTFTLRAAVEYDASESALELGEYAAEYLKRLSPHWRLFAAIEGSQDEIELIAEAQWHILPDQVIVKLNNAIGLTPKATDWAPEVGVMVVW